MSRCTCFLHSFPCVPRSFPRRNEIAANLSSTSRQFFILRRWQPRRVDPLVQSWKSRGGRRNEVAARGWFLIKNRYITPIRGSATADYAASSLIRLRSIRASPRVAAGSIIGQHEPPLDNEPADAPLLRSLFEKDLLFTSDEMSASFHFFVPPSSLSSGSSLPATVILRNTFGGWLLEECKGEEKFEIRSIGCWQPSMKDVSSFEMWYELFNRRKSMGAKVGFFSSWDLNACYDIFKTLSIDQSLIFTFSFIFNKELM